MFTDPWVLEELVRERIERLHREAAEARLARLASSTPTEEPEPTAWREAFPGVEFRPMAGGPEMMITLMRYRKGATADPHHHSSAQAGYVLEGRLRVTWPGHQLTLSAGQCYLLPPHLPHQVRALEKTVVLDFFAPGGTADQGQDVEAVMAGLPVRDGKAVAEGARSASVPRGGSPDSRPRQRRRSRVVHRPSEPAPEQRSGDAA